MKLTEIYKINEDIGSYQESELPEEQGTEIEYLDAYRKYPIAFTKFAKIFSNDNNIAKERYSWEVGTDSYLYGYNDSDLDSYPWRWDHTKNEWQKCDSEDDQNDTGFEDDSDGYSTRQTYN